MMDAQPHASTNGLDVSIDAAPPPDWDAFVRLTRGGTFCHLAGWRTIMADVLAHQPMYLTARAGDGSIAGLLPLVSVRSRLFGHYLVSMPFLNYGGAMGTAPARHALSARAQARAKEMGADLLELRPRAETAGIEEGAPPEDLPEGFTITSRKVTVLLPLPDEASVLWEDGLRGKVRSQVRRPMKEGLEARFGPGEIDAFYQVFSRNMRDLGTPVLPRAFFERLPDAFGDNVVFATIYKGDEPVAVGCGFRFRDEFELTWASSLREHNRIAPNMLLYWRLMEHAIEGGCTVFNFGRCTPDGGTHRFKKQWGGEDELLPWMVWAPGGRVATPNPNQGKYKLATSLWSRLPVPVTRLLGPPIARCIP